MLRTYRTGAIALLLIGLMGCNTVSNIIAHEDNATFTGMESSTDIDVLANDTIVIGADRELHLEINATAKHGSLAVVTVEGTQMIEYSSTEDYVGWDAFRYCAQLYVVSTGKPSTSSCARVNVYLDGCEPSPPNRAPVVTGREMTVACDHSGSSIVLEGTDADDDTLTFEINTSNVTFGEVDVNKTTGKVTITIPDDGSEDLEACRDGRPSSFTYKANDGQVDSNEGNVTINPS
jgi:hypothetical protein